MLRTYKAVRDISVEEAGDPVIVANVHQSARSECRVLAGNDGLFPDGQSVWGYDDETSTDGTHIEVVLSVEGEPEVI